MSLYNLANGELKNENDKLKLEIKRKTDEIYDLKIEKNKLKKQLEAYENMRKEAIEYIDNLRDESAERQGFYNCFPDDLYIPDINDLLNILNKVDGSDE